MPQTTRRWISEKVKSLHESNVDVSDKSFLSLVFGAS